MKVKDTSLPESLIEVGRYTLIAEAPCLTEPESLTEVDVVIKGPPEKAQQFRYTNRIICKDRVKSSLESTVVGLELTAVVIWLVKLVETLGVELIRVRIKNADVEGESLKNSASEELFIVEGVVMSITFQPFGRRKKMSKVQDTLYQKQISLGSSSGLGRVRIEDVGNPTSEGELLEILAREELVEGVVRSMNLEPSRERS